MGTRNASGVLPGTVDLLVLRTLRDGPAHGFAISRQLQRRSDGVVELQDAALYQALHRMAARGWVESEWGVSDRGKRARFYRLTPTGVKRLDREEREFRRFVDGVLRVLAFDGPNDG